jgi:hypothetical protein
MFIIYFNFIMEKQITKNRPDYIFSYWVLLWFLLYIAKIIHYNPKPLFVFGIFFSVFQIVIMFLYNKEFNYIFAFILANILMKILPFYFLYKTKVTRQDYYAIAISIFVYITWLKINNKNIYKFFIEYITPSDEGRKSFHITRTFDKLLGKR